MEAESTFPTNCAEWKGTSEREGSRQGTSLGPWPSHRRNVDAGTIMVGWRGRPSMWTGRTEERWGGENMGGSILHMLSVPGTTDGSAYRT